MPCSFEYHLVLHEPLIPPNTGNAGRLCVATQSTLHLIEPLGFSLDDKAVKRAGLDYWKWVDLRLHSSFEAWLSFWKDHFVGCPFFFIENIPQVSQSFYDLRIPSRAAFIFGKETTGLPPSLLEPYWAQAYQLPLFSDKIRSLNLANTASIVLYEAIRQQLQH